MAYNYLVKNNDGTYTRVVNENGKTKEYTVNQNDSRYQSIANEYSSSQPNSMANENKYLQAQRDAAQASGNQGLLSWVDQQQAALDAKAQQTANDMASSQGVQGDYNWKAAIYGQDYYNDTTGNTTVNDYNNGVRSQTSGAVNNSPYTTNSGTFYNSATGQNQSLGSATLTDLDNAYNGYLAALQSAQASNDAALAAALQATLADIEKYKNQIMRNEQQANTDAYIAYMQASNPYGINNERLAYAGLDNSGFAESSLIGLANQYQSNLNDNALYRQSSLDEIEAQALQAKYNNDLERAQMAADNAERLAAIQLERDQQNIKMQQDSVLRQLQLQQDQAEQEYEAALQLYKMGVVNQDIANALGVTLADLQSTQGSGNTGNGGNNNVGAEFVALVNDYINATIQNAKMNDRQLTTSDILIVADNLRSRGVPESEVQRYVNTFIY